MTDHTETIPEDDSAAHIAIIGMACRFPGANDPGEFWQNLVDGVDAVTRFPERSVPAGEYIPAAGLLHEPEWFDAGYFGYSPREARIINPQHRVFMECAVEALEDAGHDPRRHPGTIGVYAGSSENSYAEILRSQRDRLPSVTDWEIRLATGADFLGTRLAYKLGLRGPAIAVQAACATSLVAVHLAVQALLSGDCDLALAGGAAVHVPPKLGQFTEGGILSPEGTCRSFDAGANGVVGGDGVGVVVLRRLPDALAERDHIHAVIRGSAVNNDGPDRVGYTAPSVGGQAAVIRDAQLVAGVAAHTVTYVEAHGTATPVGDPIELAALTEAFRHDTNRRGFCWIGSVKSNIGHTDTAAGVAGLIKTAMALKNGVIPPSLHFSEPNPEFDLAASPFQVITRAREWSHERGPRRAGVSAFGIGGTNAHAVLEEPPEPEPSDSSSLWQLLVMSARTPSALESVTARLAARLRARPGLPVADIAWTLQVGRQEHPYRRFAIVAGHDDAQRVLSGEVPGRLVTSGERSRSRSVAFVFSGSSLRHAAIERLLGTDAEFRRDHDECLELAGPQPGSGEPCLTGSQVFSREYALARLWTRRGVTPSAVAGNGVGALVAAVVTGALTLPEAVRLTLGASPVEPRTPSLPIASVPLGRWLSPEEATDPAHWTDERYSDARMADALLTLLADPDRVLLEVGSGESACAIAGRRPEDADERLLVPTLTDATAEADAPPSELVALGRLWLAGTPIAWASVHRGERRARLPLPTYPFERQRHIVEPLPERTDANGPERNAERGDDDDGADVQAAVLRLYGEILGLDEVDPDDGFFDLGGDSLIATQFLIRIRRIFGIEVDLRTMFVAPTAAEFAALVEDRIGGVRGASPDPVEAT